jgi:hypothetical protein
MESLLSMRLMSDEFKMNGCIVRHLLARERNAATLAGDDE